MKNKKELISDCIFDLFGLDEDLISTVEDVYYCNERLGGIKLRHLSPSIDVFRKLGFIVLDLDDGYDVYIPQNWTAKKMRFYCEGGTVYKPYNGIKLEVDEEATKNNYIDEVIQVFDEEGNVRAQMRNGNLSLKRRYDVFVDLVYDCDWENIIGEPLVAFEVYFGNDEEKLFTVGAILCHESMSSETRNAYNKELKNILKKARELADEHYPEWRNFDSYWDRAKENTNLVRRNVGPSL